ncbi:MAG: radical SAM protein [Oscillospiraceae bacterium]|nr:radical SAM protein [Oscillospiraceae bacterium]
MSCELCPRRCRAEGFCGKEEDGLCVVAKTMIHRWEEPCVSGKNGSGAVFFAGCNLRCVFCQNFAISRPRPLAGRRLDAEGLYQVFLELHRQNAENINLVSPTHMLPVIRAAMRLAKARGFPLPFVWNSNGYESVEALQTLEGLVALYLPDLKYCSGALSLRYSGVGDYFEHACAALREMHRQGEILVRHMVLPGCRKDSMHVLDWLAGHLPRARLSLLAQYTPMGGPPELNRRLTGFEYQSVAEHALKLGLEGYMQGREAATAAYTPDFTCESGLPGGQSQP